MTEPVHSSTGPLLVIAGPTASGKTGLAVELARQLRGEIISADSMQVYKHLSIGTAKPTAQELDGVPCHLIDHVSPDEQYHLGRFVTEAHAALSDIHARGVVPILCGGTGMYIRGLLYGVFQGGEANPAIRAALETAAEQNGLPALFAELQAKDPAAATRYGPNDRQRIVRALEVIRATGKRFSEHHGQELSRPLIPSKTFILSWPREELYRRINNRVDQMVSCGLLQEIEGYLAAGFRRDNPAINALGYSELIDHMEGNLSLEEALETMKRKSRNYAKRQETWFRAQKPASWIDMASTTTAAAIQQILTGLESS